MNMDFQLLDLGAFGIVVKNRPELFDGSFPVVAFQRLFDSAVVGDIDGIGHTDVFDKAFFAVEIKDQLLRKVGIALLFGIREGIAQVKTRDHGKKQQQCE